MIRLFEELNQIFTNVAVSSVEEGSRSTDVSCTTSSTDTVSVLGNVVGEIVEDDVSDVGDIETSSGDGGSNENGGTAGLECVESGFTLTLGTVTVDRSGIVSTRAEEVTKSVGHTLGLDKDEDQTARLFGKEQIEKQRALVLVVDILDTLGNVFGSRTHSADSQEDVLLEETSSKVLNLSREGGGEHESLTVEDARHVFLINDSSNLRLETHVKHSVGFVKNEVLDVGKTDLASLNQVDKTTRGGGKKVTSSVEGAHLGANVGTTVNDGRSDPRSVGEFTSLFVNLRHKFSGRGKNKGRGVNLLCPPVAVASVLLNGRSGRTVGEKS